MKRIYGMTQEVFDKHYGYLTSGISTSEAIAYCEENMSVLKDMLDVADEFAEQELKTQNAHRMLSDPDYRHRADEDASADNEVNYELDDEQKKVISGTAHYYLWAYYYCCNDISEFIKPNGELEDGTPRQHFFSESRYIPTFEGFLKYEYRAIKEENACVECGSDYTKEDADQDKKKVKGIQKRAEGIAKSRSISKKKAETELAEQMAEMIKDKSKLVGRYIQAKQMGLKHIAKAFKDAMPKDLAKEFD